MTIFIYINMIAVRGVQLRLQVPPTSPVVHRDQQRYVCCENSLYTVYFMTYCCRTGSSKDRLRSTVRSQ